MTPRLIQHYPDLVSCLPFLGSVTPRPIQHYPDLYRGSIIFVDFPFQCDGSVSGVEFYAERAGTFYFSAWRPSASGDSWTLLGYNTIVSEEQGTQVNGRGQNHPAIKVIINLTKSENWPIIDRSIYMLFITGS